MGPRVWDCETLTIHSRIPCTTTSYQELTQYPYRSNVLQDGFLGHKACGRTFVLVTESKYSGSEEMHVVLLARLSRGDM